MIGWLIFLMFAAVLYFVPSIIAWRRKHRNGAAILAVNIFTGWTMIGWVAALAWSLAN